jgi:hypothetical protein
MKHLEAFTLGKRFAQPEANEDSLVILPGRGFAVIDGVTDRSGTRYGAMSSGQFASRVAQRATEVYVRAQGQPDQPDLRFRGGVHFVAWLTAALRDAYRVHGRLEAVTADRRLRASCTIVAGLLIGDRLEVVAVGDSGIRINGSETVQVLKPLDDVTSLLRRETWRYFADAGRSVEDCDALSTLMTWQGTGNQPAGSPTADPQAVAEIEKRAFGAARARVPSAPDAELWHLIRSGISHGQGDFENVTAPVLGYGGINGFDVPERHIETRSYALSEIETIELFSDGYFKLGEGFGIASWEAGFAEVAREDPNKIGAYLSTKGDTATAWADDRTYLGVRLR